MQNNKIHKMLIAGAFTAGVAGIVALHKERKQLRAVLSKYIPVEAMKKFIHERNHHARGGVTRNAAICFVDVRGFSEMSEGMEPYELTKIMNIIFEVLGVQIHKHGGVIDKYMGDSILVYWDMDDTGGKRPVQALMAARDMVHAIKKLNEQRHHTSLPHIQVGIGLSYGKVTLGNVGSEQRFDYTIMGETVNITQRIQEYTKTYKVSVFMSDALRTCITAEMEQEHDLHIRKSEEVKLRGMKKNMQLHQLLVENELPLRPLEELFKLQEEEVVLV